MVWLGGLVSCGLRRHRLCMSRGRPRNTRWCDPEVAMADSPTVSPRVRHDNPVVVGLTGREDVVLDRSGGHQVRQPQAASGRWGSWTPFVTRQSGVRSASASCCLRRWMLDSPAAWTSQPSWHTGGC